MSDEPQSVVEAEADPVALLNAGIAAVDVLLGKRSAELVEMRSGVVDLTAQEEALRSELSERVTHLNDLSERIAAWVADLRGQYGDDPDVLAALDVAEADTPKPLAQIAAGIEAMGVVVNKKDEALAEAQARLDGVLVAQAEAEQTLQREHAELETLNAEVASWFTDLQGRLAGDEELAALLQPTGDGQPVEGEAAAQPPATALLATGRAATAAAFDKHENQIAYLQSDLSGVQQLKAQADEQLADLNERAANLQAQLDAAAAEKAQLEGELTAANADLDRLLDQVGTAADGLRAAFNLPPEGAPEGEEAALAAEAQAGEVDAAELRRRKLARIGVLTAGVTSATAAFQQRSAELESAQARVGELETQVADAASRVQAIELEAQSTVPLAEHEQALADVRAQLDAATADRDRVQAELDDLNAQIADARAQIEAAIGEDEELRATFAAALQGQEAEGEGAEEAGIAGRVAGIGLLTAGMAGVVTAAHRRSEDAQQAQARLVELESQGAALGDEQTRLSADLQAREQALAEAQAQTADLQTQLDAATADRDRVQAELDDLNTQIADARAQIEAAIGEDEELRATFAAALQGQEAEGEGAEEAGIAGRVAGIGLLTAGMAGVVTAAHRRSEDAQRAQSRLVELESQGAALGDEQSRLAAELQAREQALAGSQAQVTELQSAVESAQAQLAQTNEQLAAVRADLESTQAARTQAEESLRDSQAEMDELVDRLSGLGDELRAGFGDEADFAAAEAEAERSGAGRLARLGVVSAGVGAALHRTRRQGDALQASQAQVDALTAELAAARAAEQQAAARLQEAEQAARNAQSETVALRTSLGESSGEVASRQREQETLTRQVRDLERQLAAAEERARAAEQAAEESEERARRARLAGGAGVALGGAAVIGARRGGEEGGEEAGEEVAGAEAEAAAERFEAAVPLDIPAEGEETAEEEASAQLVALQEELAAAQARLEEVNRQLASTDEERSELEAAVAQREAEAEEYRTRLADLVGSVVAEPDQADWTRLSGVKAGAARGAFLAGVKPAFSDQLQDLTLVAGIGHVLEQRLFEAGIGTYWELATMTDEDFARVLQTANLPVQRFTPSEIRASASRLAETTNTVGHIWQQRPIDDFDPLPGIGRVFEKRLYAAGIFTFEDLAAATAERLEEICKAPKTRIPNYPEWIEVARARLAERLAPAGAEPAAEAAAEESASEAPAEEPEEPPAADEGEAG